MFDAHEKLHRVVGWTQHTLNETQIGQLDRYVDWLLGEALPAGALGPEEGRRVWDRHICDALSFATAWPRNRPERAIDIGSGAGLPGIPLAILWPDTEWTLLDRSRKKVQLLRRASRVLNLPNARAIEGDLETQEDRYDAVVARGVQSPDRLREHIEGLLEPRGVAAIGLTRLAGGADPLTFEDEEVVSVPTSVLDGGAQILIIRHRD